MVFGCILADGRRIGLQPFNLPGVLAEPPSHVVGDVVGVERGAVAEQGRGGIVRRGNRKTVRSRKHIDHRHGIRAVGMHKAHLCRYFAGLILRSLCRDTSERSLGRHRRPAHGEGSDEGCAYNREAYAMSEHNVICLIGLLR